MPEIVWLRDAESAESFGNKAAALASLIKLGVNVPSGFAVGRSIYDECVSELARDTLSDDEVAATILASPFPSEYSEQLSAFLDELRNQNPESKVIVRSSSNFEDSSAGSFAGQFETIKDVDTLEACVDAIKSCWSSVWKSHVREYCKPLEISPSDIQMSVLVQCQKDPKLSGVAFTTDPMLFTSKLLYVEAVEGLAVNFVDGQQRSDYRAWLDADGRIEREDYFGDFRLSAEQWLIKLFDVCRAIEDGYGINQDIEWLSSDGRHIEIVQTRPITTSSQRASKKFPEQWELPGRPLGGWSDEQRQVFDQWDIYNSKTINPLDWDLFERVAWEANLRMLNFNDTTPHVEEVAVVVDGVPVGVDPAASQQDFMEKARVPQYEAIDDWEPVFAEWDKRLSSLSAQFDKAGKDLGKLVDLLAKAGELYAESHCVRMASTTRWIDPMGELDPAEEAKGRLIELIEDSLDCPLEEVLIDVGSGIDHETSRMNEGLWRLCSEAAANPGLLNDADFRADVESFVKHFGHFQHDNTALGNRPDIVWTQIESAAASGSAGANVVEEGRARYRSRMDKLRQALSAILFEEVNTEVNRLRIWTERRESSKSKQNIALPILRDIEKEIGNVLVAKNLASSRQDVSFLRMSELHRVTKGESVSLDGVIELRKNILDWKSTRSWLPENFFEEGFSRDIDTMIAEGVSAGIATGRVVVVDGPADFHLVRSNDIVVANTTSPIWSQVMTKISGIVVEYGARLSHTSIAAREYNIPAIINLTGATDIFRSGDEIRIDGTTGEVSFLNKVD